MAKEKITDRIYEMALPLAQNEGLGIYEVEYKKEGADYVLRVILDTVAESETEYVSIDACERVSRQLSDMLDESDPIKDAYMLEVTSPGLDRPLKRDEDFVRFAGRDIDIGLYKAVNGSKIICGKLVGLSDGVITAELPDGSEFSIKRDETSSVKLTVIF